MNFFYCPIITLSAETGDPVLILRPEIPLRLIGTSGSAVSQALVDTGADYSIFPVSIARQLGINLVTGQGPPMTAFGGQQLATWFGDIVLEISSDAECYRWQAHVQFFDFPSPEEESLILGHSGFLDYFTAIFDGEQEILTLTPNGDFPTMTSSDSS